jgi:hypothetical protein
MEQLDFNDGMRVTDLAKGAELTPQSALELVDQLEALGYLDADRIRMTEGPSASSAPPKPGRRQRSRSKRPRTSRPNSKSCWGSDATVTFDVISPRSSKRAANE